MPWHRSRRWLELRLFDALHRAADQIGRGLGDGHIVQKTQDLVGGVQTILELSSHGMRENHFNQRFAGSVGSFQKQIDRVPIFGAETLAHDNPRTTRVHGTIAVRRYMKLSPS